MGRAQNLPVAKDYTNNIRFLVQDVFPAILEKSVEYSTEYQNMGNYKRFSTESISYMDAMYELDRREYTIAGSGSLINTDQFGLTVKRPSPQLDGTGCSTNSLCALPECYSFVEGVVENANQMETFCWSLGIDCLLDWKASDRMFDDKFQAYVNTFFDEPRKFYQAYQRTTLLKNAIKVVASRRNFKFTGSNITPQELSIPFFVQPGNETQFPALASIPGGIGGANLDAFMQYVLPHFMTDDFLGMSEFEMYAIPHDLIDAKAQTASVMDKDIAMYKIRGLKGMDVDSILDSMLGGEFIPDNLMPRFKIGTDGFIEPVAADYMSPAAIYGYVNKRSPEHSAAIIAGILFVPKSYGFLQVTPPDDDFSYLGSDALNFSTSTPGVKPILSSSIFKKNRRMPKKQVIIDGIQGGKLQVKSGLERISNSNNFREENIRTDLVLTYSDLSGSKDTPTQLNRVGNKLTPPHRASGFNMLSQTWIKTDFKGSAKPVLYLFKKDTPRAAMPIEVCTTETVALTFASGPQLMNCCPGGQPYAVLTFDTDISALYPVNTLLAYRTGVRGDTFITKVTAVSGNVVTIQSANAAGTLTTDPLPCCGASDLYGPRGELVKLVGSALTSSEIFQAEWSTGSSSLLIQTFQPLAAALINATATITLETGDVINVTLAVAGQGVFWSVVAAGGETCNLSTIGCNKLARAVFKLT